MNTGSHIPERIPRNLSQCPWVVAAEEEAVGFSLLNNENIKLSDPIVGNISMVVYKQLGQHINTTHSFSEGTIKLETADLPKDFYVVTIGLESQAPLFVKILK